MSLWNVQVFDQSTLIESNVLEATEVETMKTQLEGSGYEVRAEPVSKPSSTHFVSPSVGLAESQSTIIREAIGILEARLRKTQAFTKPADVKDFCQLKLASDIDEHFCCLFLDSQHRLIAFERIFRGTVDGASVYPRVVVRRTLELNAAALILTHNHPSGVPQPSAADRQITQRLQDALRLVDVRVLDHVVVGAEGTYSFAEAGLI